MPVRAIFKQKVIDEEESDHSDENMEIDMSEEDMYISSTIDNYLKTYEKLKPEEQKDTDKLC